MASDPAGPASPLVVRVAVDEPAIAKEFDYVVPPAWRDHVRVGDMVRVALGPRRVGGWVTAVGVEAPEGVTLRPLAKLSGRGPDDAMIELCRWAAWRWAGRLAPLLTTASPPTMVHELPSGGPPPPPIAGPFQPEAQAFFAGGRRLGVLRLPPADDVVGVVLAAMALGDVLVVTPSVDQARVLAARLRRTGRPVALAPRDWAMAAAGGCSVVGARAAAFVPCPRLAAVVVLDEHDEALQEERVPCWNARDVAVERARRAGVPVLLVSPCPSLEALALAGEPGLTALPSAGDRGGAAGGGLIRVSRAQERTGWPILDIVDRSRDAPSDSGPVSTRLARLLAPPARVVCVLNRTGTARLMSCAVCKALARCERCDATVAQDAAGELVCRRCGARRPVVCVACGSTRLGNRRPGVSRIRADLERMIGEPVVELTGPGREPAGSGAGGGAVPPDARVVVGTEAALHQVGHADVVAFLDIDDELLAPRYRAGEQAAALLARVARLLGGRAGGGRLVVQTRLARHEVLDAVLHSEPERLARAELARRVLLSFPPVTALASVSGAAAEAFVTALRALPPDRIVGVEIVGPADGMWLVRAPDHRRLCDALAAVPRPAGRLRVEVDPLRL